MKIEILFPELCNLYGDQGNVILLENNFKDLIYTSYDSEPYFVKHDVDMIYLGPMSENVKIKVLDKLLKYKKRIKDLIDKKVIFLFTGNALEIMGSEIKTYTGKIIKGLSIFDIVSVEEPNKRYNSLYLGEFDNIKIVGYKSQSSSSIIKEDGLFKTIKEYNNSKMEGFRYKNFFGTNLLGPVLVLNPYFTKYIFKLLGKKDLAFEEELIDAYNIRLAEYESDISFH